jgi:hypothetical protein
MERAAQRLGGLLREWRCDSREPPRNGTHTPVGASV